MSKQANPPHVIAAYFAKGDGPCVICDRDDGERFIVMDRNHHVECFQQLMRLPQLDLTPVKRALPG